MLEICVSGYLVVAVAVSILLWQALAAAKRADNGLYGNGDAYPFEPAEGKLPLISTLASAND
jgi:hypothetical protein